MIAEHAKLLLNEGHPLIICYFQTEHMLYHLAGSCLTDPIHINHVDTGDSFPRTLIVLYNIKLSTAN